MAAELLEQHRESYTPGQTLSMLKINHELKWHTGRFQGIAELQLTTTIRMRSCFSAIFTPDCSICLVLPVS